MTAQEPADDAPGTDGEGRAVPDRAKENLDLLRRFEDEATEDASAVQLFIERASRRFGSPAYFIGVTLFAVSWIAVDSLGRRRGWPHMEPPPYFWLQGLVSFNALLLTVAVLIRQNRMSELAEHRARLDLQINLLTEQKVSKILDLVSDRIAPDGAGAEVEDLRKPADAQALLGEIKRLSGRGD